MLRVVTLFLELLSRLFIVCSLSDLLQQQLELFFWCSLWAFLLALQLTLFCPRSPQTLSLLSLHPFFPSSSLPPVHRPLASLSLLLFLRLCSHEVCIPHLLCRLDTKEQKAPLLTCSKHSSPLDLFKQLESIIHSGASARAVLFLMLLHWDTTNRGLKRLKYAWYCLMWSREILLRERNVHFKHKI